MYVLKSLMTLIIILLCGSLFLASEHVQSNLCYSEFIIHNVKETSHVDALEHFHITQGVSEYGMG